MRVLWYAEGRGSQTWYTDKLGTLAPKLGTQTWYTCYWRKHYLGVLDNDATTLGAGRPSRLSRDLFSRRPALDRVSYGVKNNRQELVSSHIRNSARCCVWMVGWMQRWTHIQGDI